MRSDSLRKLAFASMFCALTFAATWISVPAPVAGNLNIGDSVLYLAAFSLGGAWSVVACAVGAALTDVMSGAFAVYAPATLVIKALMVLLILAVKRLTVRMDSRFLSLLRVILSGVVAESVMIGGYLCYEAFFLSYGAAALANVPFNAVQGIASVVVAAITYGILRHTGVFRYFQ